ncbi:MAG TPA: ROK family transcriptional regulator [Granulicella sp.]
MLKAPTIPITISRPAHLRRANAQNLLRLIQQQSPCSRADLVRQSGLSAPTITSCVALLEEIGLVEAIGEGPSNGGRPPEMLRFNAAHGSVAAADIGGTRLRMMLADLNGNEMMQWSQLLRASEKTPAGICALAQEGLEYMVKAAGVPLSHVLHLTAGAPGITDVDAGVVISAPNLKGWEEVPLKEMLEEQLGIPVNIENDTNLAAVGEYQRGIVREAETFVFLALGTGAGAGIFLNGRLYHGARWSAGEIGYFGVSGRKREPMRIREAGQLESVIGGAGIETRWRQLLERGKTTPAEDKLRLRAPQILDLAAEGNRTARKVAQETASLLADAVADIILLLNPEAVVLGGGVGSHPELCRLTRDALKLHELAHDVAILSSALGTQAQLYGGVFTSLEAARDLLLSA